MSGRLDYDEQIGTTFTQSFTSISYNVTGVGGTQVLDSDGCAPAYLLNGLTNKGYWYQVGVSYDWSCGNGGFQLVYEVFNSSGASVFPSNGGGGLANFHGYATGQALFLLSLNFGTGSNAGNVTMNAYDWNTGAWASETYSDEGASYFVGLSNEPVNANGFFTGLMTEEYHSSPYYGTELFVAYGNQDHPLSSAWQWIDEYNVATKQGVFAGVTSSPVIFDNLQQLHEISTNGATEYGDAYVFDTGVDPVSMNLLYQPILEDAGMQTLALFSANATGGTGLYDYFVFLDNSLYTIYQANGTYRGAIDLGLLNAGTHDYYIDVVDSNGYPASSGSVTFQVANDPGISISSPLQVDQGQALQINYDASGGIGPYTQTLYVNGIAMGNTTLLWLPTVGQYQISAQITDALGYTANSSIMTVKMNPDPSLSFTIAKKTIDVGQSEPFLDSVTGGSPSYALTWYVNGQQDGEEQTSDSSANYLFNATSAGYYTVTATLIDAADFSTNSSTLQSFTVNQDPKISWQINPQSEDFFYSNSMVRASATVSGGTGSYTYSWYLNGQRVFQSTSPNYTYSLSNIGQNKLQLNVTDAVGFVVTSSIESVNYGYNLINIALLAVGAAAAIFLAMFFVLRRPNTG